jgi:hypothetical protein
VHQLLGYGAITFDNTEEGRRIGQYCRFGMTVANAWFRAAKEIQPSTNGASAPDGPTVWVGMMWVGRDGIDPIGDHAWSHGSVSADPTSPSSSRACGRCVERPWPKVYSLTHRACAPRDD